MKPAGFFILAVFILYILLSGKGNKVLKAIT